MGKENAEAETRTLGEIVAQLEGCNYECEAGPSKNNLAFVALKEMAVAEFIPHLGTCIKQVAAHLHNRGKSYIEIAVDPKTREVAWSFVASLNASAN